MDGLEFLLLHILQIFNSSLGIFSVLGSNNIISRVPNQNGVSLLYIMLRMHHSGLEPSIWPPSIKFDHGSTSRGFSFVCLFFVGFFVFCCCVFLFCFCFLLFFFGGGCCCFFFFWGGGSVFVIAAASFVAVETDGGETISTTKVAFVCGPWSVGVLALLSAGPFLLLLRSSASHPILRQ